MQNTSVDPDTWVIPLGFLLSRRDTGIRHKGLYEYVNFFLPSTGCRVY
jgi:hypothetical protein